MTERTDELQWLAQTVVDAWRAYGETASLEHQKSALHAAWQKAMQAAKMDVRRARLTLAALADATEQGRAAGDAAGYARAMREVAEYGESDPCPICQTAEWARTRAEVPRG